MDISFINIKTCEKYEWTKCERETFYFNERGGGGGKNHDHYLGRENTKTLFSRPFFFGGGVEKMKR